MAINVGFLQPILLSSILQSVIYSSGTTPVLDLNFLSSSLPAGMTFSRASAATDIINGVLTSFASGAPRISAANGYLGEQQRTNMIAQNNIDSLSGFSTWQGITAADTVPNATTAPDGTNTAYKIKDGTGTSAHWFHRTGGGYVTGTTYTYSLFVKAAEHTKFTILYQGTAFNQAIATVDLAAGTLPSVGAGVTASGIIPLDNGWYRVWFSTVATGTYGDGWAVMLTNNTTSTSYPSYTGTNSGIYIWGAQDEVGAGVTSYIPTTSASVTRAADQLYYDFSSPVAAPNTVYCHAVAPPWAASVLAGGVVETKAASGGDRISIGRVTYNTKINTKCQIGYSNQCDLFPSQVVGASVEFKSAFSNATNSFRGATNGTVSLEDTAGTAPAINRIYICGDSGGTATNFFGYVKAARVYDVAKTQSELEAVTTL